MYRLFSITAFLAAGILFSQCATKKAADTAGKTNTSEHAAMLTDLKKNFTEADLQEGKVISETKCVKCHKLFEPQGRSIAKWEYILPKMIPRTKLTEEQAAKLRAYILLNAPAG